MPIDIDISRHGEGPTKASLHLMPCKIEHNDAANVTAYFTTGVRRDRDPDTVSVTGDADSHQKGKFTISNALQLQIAILIKFVISGKMKKRLS